MGQLKALRATVERCYRLARLINDQPAKAALLALAADTAASVDELEAEQAASLFPRQDIARSFAA